MYLLYCDETNLDPKQNHFFVYGGLAIPCNNARMLSDDIGRMRLKNKINQEFQLKFNPSPPELSHDDFIRVKQEVIETAANHQCLLFVSLILHQIATSPDLARRNAINTVIYHFDCFLNRPKTHGLVLIDRFNDKQIDAHLREKFSVGLTGLPYSKEMRLERIVGYHYSAIGQSHFGSIIDIVLGSLRFAINVHAMNKHSQIDTAKKLLSLIQPLFFRDDGRDAISEISLTFSPKVIKSHIYRQKYDDLKQFLSESGIETSQVISSERLY